MHRTKLLLATLFAAIAPHAHAAESYDNCTDFIDSIPAVVSKQGTWCLRDNLGTAITSGNAIEVTVNNVTIDCNNFKIGGLAAGSSTTANGIYVRDHFNFTVRNCNIRGFETGIYATGISSGGHLIEDNGLDANTYIGIRVASSGSIIRNNRVVDTGGSPGSFAYGIIVQGGVDVIDNTINGVAGTPDSTGASSSIGISTSDNGKGSIVGNRIRALVASGTGTARGIYNTRDFLGLVVRDNDVQGSGGGIGISCEHGAATARDNIVAGFATGIDGCWSYGNAVNPN